MTQAIDQTMHAVNRGQSDLGVKRRGDDTRSTPARGAGGTLILCAIMSVVLLAGHPDAGGSSNFADVLRQEAAQAVPDAIIHGGFMLVLVIALIGFAALAIKVRFDRLSVLAAMLLALVGVGLLSASLILDGLITPSIAAHYKDAPVDAQDAARTLFALIGSAIRILMPMGLGFLGASTLAWGVALAPMPGAAKWVGMAALALGAVMVIASGVSLQATSPLALMIALGALAAWMLAGGVLLLVLGR